MVPGFIEPLETSSKFKIICTMRYVGQAYSMNHISDSKCHVPWISNMCTIIYISFRENTGLGMMAHSNLLKVLLAHCPVIHLKSSTGIELSEVSQR